MAWERDAEQASVALQDIGYLISERDNVRRSGGNVADAVGKLRGAFVKIDKSMDKLEAELKQVESNPAQYKLTQKEVLRKRDAFRKLANERTRLRGLEKSGLSATDKDALLGSNSARAPTAYSNAPQANPEQLMQRTQQEIKNQDELLGAMSKGLDSLKTMGLAIRDETDLHMRLIDDLEDGVDNAHAGLKRETARAEHVTKDAKTCWLYAAICILLAVLIALVVARWH